MVKRNSGSQSILHVARKKPATIMRRPSQQSLEQRAGVMVKRNSGSQSIVHVARKKPATIMRRPSQQSLEQRAGVMVKRNRGSQSMVLVARKRPATIMRRPSQQSLEQRAGVMVKRNSGSQSIVLVARKRPATIMRRPSQQTLEQSAGVMVDALVQSKKRTSILRQQPLLKDAHLKVLGLSEAECSSFKCIQKALRKRALFCHPDKSTGSHEAFTDLLASYNFLMKEGGFEKEIQGRIDPNVFYLRMCELLPSEWPERLRNARDDVLAHLAEGTHIDWPVFNEVGSAEGSMANIFRDGSGNYWVKIQIRAFRILTPKTADWETVVDWQGKLTTKRSKVDALLQTGRSFDEACNLYFNDDIPLTFQSDVWCKGLRLRTTFTQDLERALAIRSRVYMVCNCEKSNKEAKQRQLEKMRDAEKKKLFQARDLNKIGGEVVRLAARGEQRRRELQCKVEAPHRTALSLADKRDVVSMLRLQLLDFQPQARHDNCPLQTFLWPIPEVSCCRIITGYLSLRDLFRIQAISFAGRITSECALHSKLRSFKYVPGCASIGLEPPRSRTGRTRWNAKGMMAQRRFFEIFLPMYATRYGRYRHDLLDFSEVNGKQLESNSVFHAFQQFIDLGRVVLPKSGWSEALQRRKAKEAFHSSVLVVTR